jgi:hypothetical protein
MCCQGKAQFAAHSTLRHSLALSRLAPTAVAAATVAAAAGLVSWDFLHNDNDQVLVALLDAMMDGVETHEVHGQGWGWGV